jgi:hypothetical protein
VAISRRGRHPAPCFLCLDSMGLSRTVIPIWYNLSHVTVE